MAHIFSVWVNLARVEWRYCVIAGFCVPLRG